MCQKLWQLGRNHVRWTNYISSGCKFPVVYVVYMCQKLWQLGDSRQSYCRNCQAYFFGPPCRRTIKNSRYKLTLQTVLLTLVPTPQTPHSRPLRRLDRHVLGAQRGRAIEAKRHIRPYLFVSLQPTLSGATTAFVPPDMLRSRPMSSVCVSVVSRPSVCPSISGRGAEVQVCFFTQVGIFRK